MSLEEITSPTTDAATLLAAGAALSTPEVVGTTPYAVIPDGYQLHNLEKLLATPSRKRGNTLLTEAASFIAVVNDQKTGATRLYCQTGNKPGFTAVFNDTHVDAGWRDHRATYVPLLSPEWLIWAGANGRQQTQADFAQFIEANLPDIAEPSGADVLAVSRTLEAKKKVNFASSIRLSDGSHQFTYEEDVQGSAHKGQLKVPEVFVLAIPVFEGSDPRRIEARLRYRIGDGGKLAIWYELVRPHKVIEAATLDLRKQIADGTGMTPLAGMPAAE